LTGVHEFIDDSGIKNELLRSGVLIVFQTTESGYISKKVGPDTDSNNGLALITNVIGKSK